MKTEKLEITEDSSRKILINATNVLISSSASKKCPTKHGTIVLGEVLEGDIVPGDAISIKYDGKIITDRISMIEINNKSVDSARPGDSVGICLRTTSIKAFQTPTSLPLSCQ